MLGDKFGDGSSTSLFSAQIRPAALGAFKLGAFYYLELKLRATYTDLNLNLNLNLLLARYLNFESEL